MTRAAPAAAIAALVLAGCGAEGDGDGQRPATAGSATATTATAAAAPASASAQAPPRSRTDRVSNCLTGLGYRLTGGASQGNDPDVADYQIVLDSPRGGGYIGYYRNPSRAERVVKQLRKNATRFSGTSAERNGAVNIVWVDLPDKAARASVRACLVD